MRCFVHRDVEAVGTCRGCSKGVCAECVVDLGHSISCRGACEAKAQALHTQSMQSGVLLRAQRRNRFLAPALFIVMGIAIVLFAGGGGAPFNYGTVMGGGFILFGIVLAVLQQRYARELDRSSHSPGRG
jgi:multisubunit Na+/H+ antiporter MnhB subunit